MAGMRPLLLALTCAAVCAAQARADDVLVLSTGREVRGEIVEENDTQVKVRIDGGALWYPRSRIVEIRRDVAEGEDAGTADQAREESAVLYADGERAGARTLRYLPRGGGHQWEESVVFLGSDGMPQLEVRTLERSDRAFHPELFQVQETTRDGRTRLVRGEVVGSRLEIEVTVDGETSKTVTDVRPGARFPFAAREEFVRAGKTAAPTEGEVFDVRDRRWRPTSYRNAGERVVGEGEAGVTVRVIERRRGELLEFEWVGPDGRSRLSDLNGPALRALAAPASVVAAVAGGEPDRVTGSDSAARTRYADVAEPFEIRKPDPTWLFEEPRVGGGATLVTVRNRALAATVDVLRDRTAPEGVTLDRAADALERVLAAHAVDLRVVQRGRAPDGSYAWVEAQATTKGERTHTLAHVRVVDGRVYRLLAACPEERWELVRPELERILLSFRGTADEDAAPAAPAPAESGR